MREAIEQYARLHDTMADAEQLRARKFHTSARTEADWKEYIDRGSVSLSVFSSGISRIVLMLLLEVENAQLRISRLEKVCSEYMISVNSK